MSQNPSISQLDGGQIVKRVFDETNDAVRISLGDASGIAINTNASEDSITTYPNTLAASATLTNASTGVVIPATSCYGLKSFVLYTNTVTAITDAKECTLEISPSDTDNVWISAGISITPSVTQNAVIISPVQPLVTARRCRVSIASAITAGSFKLYLVGQAV